MKRKSFSIFIGFLFIAASLGIIYHPVLALPGNQKPVMQSSLPQIVFLGSGPGTFTIEPSLKFLVKTYVSGQFLFETLEETEYTAKKDERVWTINATPKESMRLFHEWKDYGDVSAGCVVNYVQIEDNIDSRRNTFYINGNVLQVVEQGMVTYGSFVVPEDGELTFYAQDSIGMLIEVCQEMATTTPTGTLTIEPGNGTATFTPTAQGIASVEPTGTWTISPDMLTLTATLATETPLPSATATGSATVNPAVTDTALPSATAAATQTPVPPTATFTPTATEAAPVIIPSNTSVPPTATQVVVVEPTQAPTATYPASGVVIPTITNTPYVGSGFPSQGNLTPTRSMTATATLTRTPVRTLVTATPISTPIVLPVTGGGPGPKDIAVISVTIVGLFGLLSAAWWALLRIYQHE